MTITSSNRLDNVKLYITRQSDGQQWNGSSWVATGFLSATVTQNTSNNTWNVSSGFPTGSNLNGGTYTLSAIAYDKAGNSASNSATTITIVGNNVVPTVTITSPVSAAFINLSPTISGTASVSAGTGPDNLNRVEVYVQRQSDGYYWNGTAFVAASTYLSATLSGSNWTRTTTLPDGVYDISAIAVTNAGQRTPTAQVPSRSFTLDTVPPTASVVTPTSGATIISFGFVSGNYSGVLRVGASDTLSKPDKVNVYIYRYGVAPYEYWDFTNHVWTTSSSPFATLQCNGINGSWPVPAADLPPLAPLDGSQDGTYHVRAISYDRAGNISLPADITVTIDQDDVLPTVSIVDPVNGTTRSTLGPINGIAEDTYSGLIGVRVILSRLIDENTPGVYEYWNWDTLSWGTGYSLLLTPSTPFGVFNWSVPANLLPTGSTLRLGKHYIRTIAYDRGQEAASTPTHLLILSAQNKATTPAEGTGDDAGKGTTDDPPSEEVGKTTVSEGAAHSSNSSITLQWSAPLDSNWAEDWSAYVVWINGEIVLPQSAIYNGTTNQVTLLFPPKAFAAGDDVKVCWFWLHDEAGQAIANGS